jgi:hypothetical protein
LEKRSVESEDIFEFNIEGNEAELFSKMEVEELKKMTEAHQPKEIQSPTRPSTDVRTNVIREIYHTEQTYIQYLSLLLNV